MHNCKKLAIYERSLSLAIDFIPETDSIRPYKLAEQIAGSCVSVPSNIAEGSERSSEKDFLRFIEYAAGSNSELITQLKICIGAKRMDIDLAKKYLHEAEEIHSMIHGFMNNLRK